VEELQGLIKYIATTVPTPFKRKKEPFEVQNVFIFIQIPSFLMDTLVKMADHKGNSVQATKTYTQSTL
jgi:hypothetical protein